MIVSIANQKGGVGKTTTAINLAAALALRGKPTLLIDLDPQGNSSLTFIDPRTLTKNVFDAFVEPNCGLKDIIVPTAHPHLFLAPARISLAKLEAKLVGELDAHFRLKDRLEAMRDEFEYMVIDCPPTLGLLTVNALVASSHLLIPIQSSYFALEGTDDLLETVDKVRARANPALQIVGVVITMHDRRTALGKDIKQADSQGVRPEGLQDADQQERAAGGEPRLQGIHLQLCPRFVGRDRVLQPVRGGHRTCLDEACQPPSACATTSTTWKLSRLRLRRRSVGCCPSTSSIRIPNQPRQVMGDLSELVASIAEKGIIEPIIVRRRQDRFQIIAGERRYQAAVQAGLAEVPAIIRDIDDDEVTEIALIENLQRKDLTPFEEAEALGQLSERAGLTHDQIAKRLGKSRTAVTETLALNQMPEEVRNLCRLADIHSKSLLLQIVRQSDHEKMIALIERASRQASGEAAGDARIASRAARRRRPAQGLRLPVQGADQGVQSEAQFPQGARSRRTRSSPPSRRSITDLRAERLIRRASASQLGQPHGGRFASAVVHCDAPASEHRRRLGAH